MTINTIIKKVDILLEALPYIKMFKDSIFVIKYGGAAMNTPELKYSILEDIALLKFLGVHPVLVHGGGPAINSMLNRLNIKPQFIDGLRVTDEETMEVVRLVLGGDINKKIAANLNHIQDCNAIGLTGSDGIFTTKPHPNSENLGWVGDVDTVNTELLTKLIHSNIIPVIASVGNDDEGNFYNVNADAVASSIASSLKADKLVVITDVLGILDEENNVISTINSKEIEELKDSAIITGGMIPKVDYLTKSLKNGTKKTYILDGRIKHSILLEIFTESGIGTEIII